MPLSKVVQRSFLKTPQHFIDTWANKDSLYFVSDVTRVLEKGETEKGMSVRPFAKKDVNAFKLLCAAASSL